MIIVNIIGGLGNQLFQYAVGKAIATKHCIDLKLDVSKFTEPQLRNFDLLNFNLNINFATTTEIQRYQPQNKFQKIIHLLTPHKWRTFYKEKHFHFDKRILDFGKNIYLKGYFQSEQYFSSYKKQFQIDLIIKDEVLTKVKELGEVLKISNSVSVHFRRGDFATKSETLLYHGILEADYYLQAIEIIKSKIETPSFYFFSDDIQWVKENFQLPGAVYVSENLSKNHIEDLYLMSCCRHNIIANSSFSWWGAWLNKNVDKIVIAPQHWFNKGPKDTQDLIPDSWIKI
ncbi:MAG: alpha-1,2-fucosyltransferase [Chitinophagaceae bacterium]|nr:MAG: alpha-1,2-fucosyltransferase [Chitinophagaceae bacterium]